MQEKQVFSSVRKQLGLSIREVAFHAGCSARTAYRWEHRESIPSLAVIDRLQKAKKVAEEGFTFVDLFAGIGGFRKAFESVGGTCVFTSEWNRWCRETYQANFDPVHEIVGDITKVAECDIPCHDVLVAGFPCQPFSLAGVSKKNALNMPHGFKCEIQGNLFFDIARIIKHHQPKAFVLENVKNLKSHDNGRTYGIICHTLKNELGYSVFEKIIDAQRWVPQHRERIFIVGFKDKVNFSFDEVGLSAPKRKPKLKHILHPEDGSEKPELPYTKGVKGKVAPRYTLSSHLWQYLQEYAKKHKSKGNGFGYGLFGPENIGRTLSARYYKDGAELLIRQKNKRPRRLTPRECARLMGFENKNSKPFKIPVSDAQAYRQFGNAVVVPVATDVARLVANRMLENRLREISANEPKHTEFLFAFPSK